MDRIVLVGAGGHAKTIVDTIERQGRYEIAGFVERNGVNVCPYRSYSVIGTDDDLPLLYEAGIHAAVISVGYLVETDTRIKLYCLLKKIGYELPIIIDDTAVIADDVEVGEGTYIGRKAIINAAVVLGRMCIVNSAAIIEHDCVIEDFSHIAVAAVLCGNVKVGKTAFVGANATIVQNVSIGEGCFVKAGSLVKGDLGKMRNDKNGGVKLHRSNGCHMSSRQGGDLLCV